MLVHFVTDKPTKIPVIRTMLEPRYRVIPCLLGQTDAEIGPSGVLMVDVDLRQSVCVEQIKSILQNLRRIRERLFIVQTHIRQMVAQAYALGATAVVSRPREIIAKLARIEVAERAALEGLTGVLPEITDGAAALAAIFSAAHGDGPINVSDAERATSQIIGGVAKVGLGAWLDDVRRHHEGTFQHCLLVTGVAVGFAMEMGFVDWDVKRLGLAATLHDIGKARIPLSILEKPGSLDATESEIMRRHPAIGYDLLAGVSGINPEILEGVRHHHEYLDGSGYPDGLKAAQISDLVRLLTISDIFAALIEARPYRPAMPRATAYKILCGMDGKLEVSLLKAFRKVALAA
jgi:putative nucleotidyltransferase with HDIG domain